MANLIRKLVLTGSLVVLLSSCAAPNKTIVSASHYQGVTELRKKQAGVSIVYTFGLMGKEKFLKLGQDDPIFPDVDKGFPYCSTIMTMQLTGKKFSIERMYDLGCDGSVDYHELGIMDYSVGAFSKYLKSTYRKDHESKFDGYFRELTHEILADTGYIEKRIR